MLSSDIVRYEILPYLVVEELYQNRYLSNIWYNAYWNRLQQTMLESELQSKITNKKLSKIPPEPVELAIQLDEPAILGDVMFLLNPSLSARYLYKRASNYRSIDVAFWLISKFGLDIVDKNDRWFVEDPRFADLLQDYPLEVLRRFGIKVPSLPVVDDPIAVDAFFQDLPQAWYEEYHEQLLPHILQHEMLNVLYEVIQDHAMLEKLLDIYYNQEIKTVPFVELLLIPELQSMILPQIDVKRFIYRLSDIWDFDSDKVHTLLDKLSTKNPIFWSKIAEFWLARYFPSKYFYHEQVARIIVSDPNWVQRVIQLVKLRYSVNLTIDMILYEIFTSQHKEDIVRLTRLIADKRQS